MRASGKRTKGYVLLEVILASLVFAVAAVALARSLHQVVKAASTSQQEAKVLRMLQSTLIEASKFPVIEESVTELDPDEEGYEVVVAIEPLELKNAQEQPLPDMYRVIARVSWSRPGKSRYEEPQVWEAETYRYARLYR